MTNKKNLPLALFLLRITVFAVMLTWTIDKFVRPAHATKIFESFYFIPGIGSSLVYILGGLELLLLLLFVLGIAKKITYGLALLFQDICGAFHWREHSFLRSLAYAGCVHRTLFIARR